MITARRPKKPAAIWAGDWGRGGDLLYRWGNPRDYRNGTRLDQRLFFQHNIQWIPKGLRGEGHLLVFNNGSGRQPEEFSSVDEFEPPTDKAGSYVRREHAPFGPDAPLWSYSATNRQEFFSGYISGAQRLPNGNTLINAGAQGIVFEVNPEKEMVWKCVNPFKNPPPPGSSATEPVRGAAERRSRLSWDERRATQETRRDRQRFERCASTRFSAREQKKVLNNPGDIDLSKVPPGDYLVILKQDKLKLTEAQAKALQSIQTEFNPRITAVFTDDQKRLVDDHKKSLAADRTGTPRKGGNSLFRATRYALDYPAFQGRALRPGKTLVEIQEERDRAQGDQDATLAKAKTGTATN